MGSRDRTQSSPAGSANFPRLPEERGHFITAITDVAPVSQRSRQTAPASDPTEPSQPEELFFTELSPF